MSYTKDHQEDQENCSEATIHNLQQCIQEQLLLHHQEEQENMEPQSYMNQVHFQSNSEMSQILPWTLPPVQPFNSVHHHDPFLLPPSPSPYGLFNRRPQFGYEGATSSDHGHLRFISDTLVGQVVHHQPGSAPFGLQAELQKMTAQEIMDAKALAASKSHSEAERRRRERINNHLAKLRSLLPNTTKTDKASLLAEVIQHVKELKRQTSLIAETSPVPTEIDELTVDNATSDEDGKFVIKASLCCEDRSDLLPDLIKTLKALRLKTLKAEITTLGGRVRNVLFITGDDCNYNNNQDLDPNTSDDDQQQPQYCISSIQEALKAVMEKSSGDDSSSASVKRQRTNNINILT
ncbi:transcription factor bHLH30-like isoform X1 [Lycium barbarum]|uniref:transcription factor bHLH30-like isoform X1 n=2 Tax=Lycium ferocissimum TaxID=112874 RepID=UPI002814A2E9|nr:transcription factor bHLH30-like isoform X1 [Lycium ferocissimum]XP_060214906.1 transcription factor bHLH30-like isoform X1 [Lycium barbarum]